MIHVKPVPAFNDNYIWLLHRDGDKRCVVVDPGDARPVLQALDEQGLALDVILITHHHPDHTGGLGALLEHRDVPVYGPASEAIRGVSHPLREGDTIFLDALDLELGVLDVPGHTAGHIAFYGDNMLFCGDTLFAGGCGRLFEGTPAQMHHSLEKLAALPESTRVYCAHEYTLANLRFALKVDPDNAALQERLRLVEHQRDSGECTLPSTLEQELKTNPFLRSGDINVKQRAESKTGHRLNGPVDVFAAVRAWKDAG
ncbi:MAG: hydroxyacylglutathione hydrolase [Ectothiorhodospiraceae bacterium]|nr:hydroxyacylglutathione hydrolase [Ectothiorhodospiraceae bacterium]MCH8505408.1 hydroxyacylglutathione hydrolase [Ectothiorhodospiraceae bacterium]